VTWWALLVTAAGSLVLVAWVLRGWDKPRSDAFECRKCGGKSAAAWTEESPGEWRYMTCPLCGFTQSERVYHYSGGDW
jgi:hypothetical protein